MAEEGADLIALDIASAAADLAVTAAQVEAHGRRCVTAVALPVDAGSTQR
jgi:hypothetical protein